MNADSPNPGSQQAIDEGCKPIPTYEDRYEVSIDGRVFSLNWEGNTGLRKELKQHIRKGKRNKIGYSIVRLHKEKSVRSVTVGRLVLEAFAGANKLEVNHKDGNTLNNHLDNLEYTTRSENQKHAIRNGLARTPPSPRPIDSGKRYFWVHKDGRKYWATPSMLAREIKGDISYLFRMAAGEKHHLSYRGWKIKPIPSPGSDDAVDVFCTCPVLDNGHGRGYMGMPRIYVMQADCPLHGMPVKPEPQSETDVCLNKKGGK